MAEALQNLTANLVDILIYTATALVTLTALVKCVLPLRRLSRLLRRAVHQLEIMVPTAGTRPVWQDVLFLGRPLQGAWRKFLLNAEQLDTRGMACDVSEYINDDSVIYQHGSVQFGEVTPGLLTSLGILGTFIGLMRGLGGLDVSTADATMASISQMIGGMTFAFMTSIVGIACSLAFNILNRAVTGSCIRAIDEFNEAFSEIVMHQPLTENVQAVCQREDGQALIRHAVTDMNARIASGIEVAIERSFTPVSQSMNSFILAETQAQIEGVGRIVNQFIGQMNGALDGQFLRLGQTLTAVNQGQEASFEGIQRAMMAADGIMRGMDEMHGVTQQVMDRFEHYIAEISANQTDQTDFTQTSASILSGMHAAMQEQSACVQQLQLSQARMQTSMQEYADWSSRVLTAVETQSGASTEALSGVADGMKEGGRMLADSYASFVENISSGLARTLGMFDENMQDMMNALQKKLSQIEKTLDKAPDRLSGQVEGYVTSLSKLQRAMSDIAEVLQKAQPEAATLAEGA